MRYSPLATSQARARALAEQDPGEQAGQDRAAPDRDERADGDARPLDTGEERHLVERRAQSSDQPKPGAPQGERLASGRADRREQHQKGEATDGQAGCTDAERGGAVRPEGLSGAGGAEQRCRQQHGCDGLRPHERERLGTRRHLGACVPAGLGVVQL